MQIINTGGTDMKKIKKLDWKFFGIVVAAMCVLYILTRYCMGSLYTPEWVARQLFPFFAGMITAYSLSGKRRIVVISFIGYISGLVAGEIFGGFESHIGPQYHHWGWLIFIIVFIIFFIAAILVEKKTEHQ